MFINSMIMFLLAKFHIILNLNNTIINLKDNGLYYEDSRYVYKGSSPNNYILFNEELWRIIYIDNDGIKIMKNNSIGEFAYDNENSNIWQYSSLQHYLNNNYYNSLSGRNYIVLHDFDTIIYQGQSLRNMKDIKKENSIVSNVGLITIKDFLLANDNKKCDSINSYIKNDLCRDTNYINKIIGNAIAWSITNDNASNNLVVSLGNYYFGDSLSMYEFSVYPSLYLNRNIRLGGNGNIESPYYIK